MTKTFCDICGSQTEARPTGIRFHETTVLHGKQGQRVVVVDATVLFESEQMDLCLGCAQKAVMQVLSPAHEASE